MHPFRFWLLFVALATAAVLFAGSVSAASPAGKNRLSGNHRAKLNKQSPSIKKSPSINQSLVVKDKSTKPIVKIGTAYIAELRRK